MIAHQIRALLALVKDQRSVPSMHIVAQNYLLLESLGMILLASLGTNHTHDIKANTQKEDYGDSSVEKVLIKSKEQSPDSQNPCKSQHKSTCLQTQNYLEMGSRDKKIPVTHRPASPESKTG